MKRFSEQLKRKSESIRLKVAEKRDLRESLLAYIEYHPLPATMTAATVPATQRAIFNEVFHFIRIPSRLIRSVAILAAVFLFIIVPGLAEQTIPGDILYPVKGITEDIRGSLNLTPYEKVAWETTRLERRVDEARQLAKEGKLTPTVEAGVLAAVQEHKIAAEDQIKSLQSIDSEGASLAQITFATALDVQGALLRSDSSSSTSTVQSTDALASALAVGSQEAITESTSAPVSFERIMAQLEIETTRAYDLLESNISVATDQEQTDTRRRLTDLELKISGAAGKHETDSELAVTELRNAWSDLQKLIAFMTDINVRTAVSLESLVPVVLTHEERVTTLMTGLSDVQSVLVQITDVIASTTLDTAIINKVDHTLPLVKSLIATATSSLALDDLATAALSISQARSLEDSMVTMIGRASETADSILDTLSPGQGTTASSSIDTIATTTLTPAIEDTSSSTAIFEN